MIPTKEHGNFRLTVAVAALCAEDGTWSDGYTLLLQGYRHARNCALDGEDWGFLLVRLYRRALDAYVSDHSV
jgi:hypothetical protein